MSAGHEDRVRALAERMGLVLSRTREAGLERLYQLVEAESMAAIYPGDGAALVELEDWLGFPWE